MTNDPSTRFTHSMLIWMLIHEAFKFTAPSEWKWLLYTAYILAVCVFYAYLPYFKAKADAA